MTIKERLKAWWEYFLNVYSAYGNKKEVPDPFIDELKSKGFEYEEDKQRWIRTWSTNNGEEKCYEVYDYESETKSWHQVMLGQDGLSIIFENKYTK